MRPYHDTPCLGRRPRWRTLAFRHLLSVAVYSLRFTVCGSRFTAPRPETLDPVPYVNVSARAWACAGSTLTEGPMVELTLIFLTN